MQLGSRTLISLLVSVSAVFASDALADPVDALERVTHKLVPPPSVPAHEQKISGPPRVVQVRMVIEEKRLEVAP